MELNLTNITHDQPISGPDSHKFAIKSSNVILEEHSEPIEAIICIDMGKIEEVVLTKDLSPEELAGFYKAWSVKDYGDFLIFPGLIDSNVHLHAGYDDEWENIEFCTRLAASSGVTTIVENPIMTAPFSSSGEYLQTLTQTIEKVKEYSKVDFGIYGILEPKTKNNVEQILDKGVLGLKCFIMKCFQTEIGHFAPEILPNIIKDLEKKFPEALLVIHPEVATERELFLTSPCRTVSPEKRVDFDYDIKSIERTGAANKGSYIDDMDKLNNGDEEDNEGENGPVSPESPSKLRGRIMKLKEKTEVNDIVHFELLSYSLDNNNLDDTHQNGLSSDSDIDFLEKLSKDGSLKGSISEKGHTKILEELERKEEKERNISEGSPTREDGKEQDEEDEVKKLEGLMAFRRDSRNKSPIKKSRFAKLYDDKSQGSERGESPYSEKTDEKSDMGILMRKLLSIKRNDTEDSRTSIDFTTGQTELLETIPSEEKDGESSNQEQKQESNTNTQEEISKNKNTYKLTITPSPDPITLIIPSHDNPANQTDQLRPSIEFKPPSFLLEEKLPGNDSPPLTSESIEERPKRVPTRRSQFLTMISNPSSRAHNSTSSLLLELPESPDSKKNSRHTLRKKVSGLRLDTSSLDKIGESPNISPSFSNRPDTPLSSLLQRRISQISHNSSCNTSTRSSPRQIKNFCRLGSEGLLKPETNSKQNSKFEQSYKTFLANRPQNWEENAVSRVLKCVKQESKVRILLQNLSLASSFLKIRQKKKKNEFLKKKLFSDTSPAYLFFNEKMIKNGETKYKTSPPFRSKENQRLLVETMRLGGIDLMSSYHFYVPPRFKLIEEGNFRRAFGGIESMGCSLQAAWTAAYSYLQKKNKKFREDSTYQKNAINKILRQLYKTMCSNPAQLLKIDNRKGSIMKGKDADFVIWDPYKVDDKHRLGYSHLFTGRYLLGTVHKTYLRGILIYSREDDEQVSREYKVEFLRREEKC